MVPTVNQQPGVLLEPGHVTPPPIAPPSLLLFPIAKQHELMTLDGFIMYLLSPEGAALNTAHTCVFQDMSQPLAHYFISSSHNTYLTDSQIGGPSSTEAYIRYNGEGENMGLSTLHSLARPVGTPTLCPSIYLSTVGPLPRDAAVWNLTAGRAQEGNPSSITATRSPPRSSFEM